MKALKLYLSIIFISSSVNLYAQNQAEAKLDAYAKLFPVEKLYLSFDKPYYNVGDTLWFKSFLLNGDLNKNIRTDKIYVELFNDSLKFIENRVIVLNNGLGYGDFALKNTLKEGTYTIRAYSNWQQNFGDDYFFQKSFYVGNVGENTWLLDSYQKLNSTEEKSTLDLKIRITNIKNEAAGLRDVEVYLMNDNKRVMRADLQTKADGTLETQIPLSDNKITNRYSFYIVDKKDKTRKAVLPILLQNINEVDLQFMPEGGYMVNGIYGKVAFKAIGADGIGKNINGKIVNSKNETIAELNTTHKGMGSFYILPQKGEKYFAVFNLNNKEQKKNLPLANEEGTTLRIDQFSKKDSIYVYVKASEGKRADKNYMLLVQSAQETIMSAALNLKNGFSTIKLSKQDFPDGIIHFTLFSPEQLPINERQVFINHNQKINLKIEPGKSNYNLKDSVAMEITATKEDGSPLSGSFAIAVTDNNQVKQNSNENTIVSYFLLQSDIKGNIEDPSWYFSNTETSTLMALDYLLLTQAWIGYKWDDMLKPNIQPKFKAEKDNIVEGKLTNLFNKPVPNINLTMMSLGKTIFVTDTISNAEGLFKFTELPYLDSAVYTIKIKNAKGKTAMANIFVEEFTPAKDISYTAKIKPWYVNTDSTTLNYYKNIEKTRLPATNQKLALEGTMLNEVQINGQTKLKNFIEKTAWDSKLFKQIGEEELKKMPRKTLMDLLNEKIPGFTTGSFYADGCFGTAVREINGMKLPPAARPYLHKFSNFMIGNYLISHVMIDKINTHLVSTGMEDPYNANTDGVSKTAIEPDVFLTNKHIFNTLSAEDIKDITIYKGCSNYYLDITTRSGKGPWIVTTPGIYVYRPLPVYRAKEFYNPKYDVNKNTSTPDYRSTIFWDANVITDENGKAKVSFYTADKPSTYTIKIEGTDLFGRFGYKTQSITISNKTESK